MSTTTAPLRIGHLSTAYHTALLLRGAGWTEERLRRDVQWRLFPTGPDITNAFSQGQLDIGYIGLTPAMIGIGRGIPITCVAGGHIEGTVMVGKSGFASFQELGEDLSATLSQFKGRSIGCPKRGSIHDIIIRHYLAEYGLQEAVGVKNFDCAEFIAEAMRQGEVEAGVATPCLIPYTQFFFSLDFTSKVLVPPYQLWPYNPSYGIFVRSDLAREEPETIEGFLETHEAATAYVRSQPEQAAKIVAGVMEIVDEAYVTEAYRISPRYCAALPNEYISSTLRFVPVLRSLGYLKQELTQEEIFDLRFLKKIHPEPAHYHDEPRWSKV